MGCGFAQTGVSFLDAIGGVPPPLWRFDASGFARLQGDPREAFYHDLEEEEGKYWVSRLTRQSQRVLREGADAAYAGWLDVPVWYLVTGEDRTLTVEVQRVLVERAREAGADVVVREVRSGHSPMLSRPEETVEFILEAVGALVG